MVAGFRAMNPSSATHANSAWAANLSPRAPYTASPGANPRHTRSDLFNGAGEIDAQNRVPESKQAQ
jgi:hypothetical protein